MQDNFTASSNIDVFKFSFNQPYCIIKITYTYWKEKDGVFLGYLNEFPDRWTQRTDLENLIANLADLYKIFTQEEIPGIKQVAEFELVG